MHRHLHLLHQPVGGIAALGRVVEGDLRDLAAKLLDQLAESFPRRRIGVLPGVRLDEREHGGERPVLGGGRQQTRAARDQAGRVALVMALQHVGDERQVLHRAAVHPDRVERVRLGEHAGAGNEPEGRLEAVDAAEGARADDGAYRLRAERTGHHAGGDGGGRAGG